VPNTTHASLNSLVLQSKELSKATHLSPSACTKNPKELSEAIHLPLSDCAETQAVAEYGMCKSVVFNSLSKPYNCKFCLTFCSAKSLVRELLTTNPSKQLTSYVLQCEGLGEGAVDDQPEQAIDG